MMLLAGSMARAKKTRTSTKKKSSRRRAPARARGRKPAAGKTRRSGAASPGQGARIAQLEAENRRLREELEALRAERSEGAPIGEQSPTMDL